MAETGRSPRVAPGTKEAERVDAVASHQADRLPTEDEEARAEESTEELERSGMAADVAEHHKQMDRLGAEQRGEGRID